MNWNNLKNYKCPKCSNGLKEEKMSCESNNIGCATSFRKHVCSKCEFSIGEQKYNEILVGKKKNFDRNYEDNLSELNNYGRKERSEDFSDSKYLN